MLKDIVAVKPLEGYKLYLKFEDDKEGVVDVSQLIQFSGVFTPLEELSYFTQVKLHPELGTIVWPNDADLDPDVLYGIITGQDIYEYEGIMAIQNQKSRLN
ncbi:MAG TPA: DUF2442 domain-containing protein [Cyanobacteria bacterium UBA11149]|nr:DUF2442 domain-containing protein [Cyanobacteria bacterium UBA11367]HBE58759.1 DUF2442 domain-containing protein [Cyanobacteria bacterium UBA11366]HBK63725.1 DUF2442 domain-containing protein [Cyanobacteria bacterium UBA11166]HBR73253.1 DUF2442 domain-containing protein [Cyanobacteria bacterium UBA11159]HBS68808.1 DUF2442 domain-containing protein [Cyanobacteria bacterium UBA11153]HBW92442.1 DUF2442 domain-containing protein [Cyanobacteria bacterium UBA11149]HCA97483.1 DUF2442 domain-conta